MKIMQYILSFIVSMLLLTSCHSSSDDISNFSSYDEADSSISAELLLHDVILEYKEMLDEKYSPFTVSGTYYSAEIDFNNDCTNDYMLAYMLYSQFQFVVLDGQTGEVLFESLIMTDFIPSKTICEIYTDSSGNFAERFASKIQKAASSGITETAEVIVNSEAYIFEAVYDKETGEYVHSYDKYNSYEEYISAQNKVLAGYSLIENVNWEKYNFSKEKSAR